MRLVRYFPAELAYLYQGAQGCWYMVFPTDITDLDTYSIFEGGHADFADDADF